ncbi:MAG: DUF2318 domain-containing protein [Proteobacteria bacterium]|nr:DUF2318 domain-containing protein [Pseudomonadota bacterium]
MFKMNCCGGDHQDKTRKPGDGKEKKSPFRWIILTTCIALFAAVVFLFQIKTGSKDNNDSGQAGISITPVAWASEITHPVSSFSDGKARYFQHKTNDGYTIRYFIIKSSDGVIRAAFDACDVCFQSGRGYYQKDDFMVCRNCGRRFLSTKVNEVTGGCNPAPLVRKIENNNVVIQPEDILRGKQFFPVKGGRG